MTTMTIYHLVLHDAYRAKIVTEGGVCVRAVSSVPIGNTVARDGDMAANVWIHNLQNII